jgi:hypothetical protein
MCVLKKLSMPAKKTVAGPAKKKKTASKKTGATFTAQQVVALVNEKAKVAAKRTPKKKAVKAAAGTLVPAPMKKKAPRKDASSGKPGILNNASPAAIGIAVRTAVAKVIKDAK